MPLTPYMVDSNFVYENVLVYNIQRQNLLTTTRSNYYLQHRNKVRIRKFQEETPIGHIASNYFDGTWTVQGYVNKLILVTNGDNAFLVPSWMLVRIS